MLWNQLEYDVQKLVINKLKDLLKIERNLLFKMGLEAAILELEIWSNSPIETYEDNFTALAEFANEKE